MTFKNRVHLSSTGFLNIYDKYDIKKDLQENHECFNEMCKLFENFKNFAPNETIVFYGTGEFGDTLLKYFNITANDFKNIIFCDKKANEIKTFENFPVITPDELIEKYANSKIFITTHMYHDEVLKYLLKNGISKDNINNKMETNMIELFNFFMQHIRLPFIDNLEKQYFDEVVKFDNNEVFIDAGVLDGGTSFEFAKNCPNYKKIYLFEPSQDAYTITEENIKNRNFKNTQLFKFGLYNEKTTLKFQSFASQSSNNTISENGNISIDINTLDNVFIKNSENLDNIETPTFIKMDIEGAELPALQGGAELIKKHKPKLAISIYHKPEDIIEIPAFIKSLVPEYKFYIRHYTNTVIETVLYAIP